MKPIKMKIKVDDTKIRNEFHFDVQRNTKAAVFKDKTKYTRKQKHKKNYDEE